MKLTSRNTHRDIAYFYVGLIISFSLSGIFLNHRQTWHPRRFTYEKREITVTPLPVKESINEEFITSFSKAYNIDDDLRRFSVDGDNLRISYTSHDVQIDITTGKGKIEEYRTTPIIGQMTILHQSSDKWWVYYSDVFGVAMLTIAITGMFIEKGKKSFRKRGWKLAIAGIVFPLVFLYILS